MKVILKTPISSGGMPGNLLPKPGDVGEAIYFRYNDEGELHLVVLFYGYPGMHEVFPESVESLVAE